MNTRRAAAMLAMLWLAGCGGHTGPTERESRTVERDAAETLRAELKMGGGVLKVGGGSPNWLQAEFSYNQPSSKPSIRYTNAGGRGDLTVEQGSSGSVSLRNTVNEWDLRLNDKIPTDLIAHIGGGDVRFDLGTLSLRSVRIEMGAGELRVDLRGSPSRDYDVSIRGGAGEATVYLPRDVGVYAKAKGGLGEIKVQGLREEGGHWVNDAYATSKVKIRLDIEGGVGPINLLAN